MKQAGYRPEIDGLRAVAVLAVVIFHAGFTNLSGGFIGVDIFFVISGYLITGIIYQPASPFSYKDFYNRRIKRLFPALIFTIATSFIFAYFILTPKELKSFSLSAILSIIPASNILFWQESGYFDTSAAFKPLLHTWSLSVEEQFYIFWPAILIAMGKLLQKRHIPYAIVALTAASLILSQYMVYTDKNQAYYLTPYRAFELLTGSILVWIKSERTIKEKYKNILFITATTSLTALFFIYNKSTPFPGINALFVCALTAVIILVSDSSLARLILANKPMVGLGLISYSLYLIHWPITVFYKLYFDANLTIWDSGLIIILSLLSAIFMYYYVERPFRYSNSLPPPFSRKGAIIYLCAAFIVLLPSAHAALTQGWLWRLPKELQLSIKEIENNRNAYWRLIDEETSSYTQKSNRVLVIGNSFAIDIFFALKSTHNYQVRYSGSTSHECYALSEKIAPDSKIDCQKNFKALINNTNTKNADFIIINERWVIEKETEPYLKSLSNSIQEIKKINPQASFVIVGPRQTFDGASVYKQIIDHGRLTDANQLLSRSYHSRPAMLALNKELQKFSNKNNYLYIDIDALFCHKEICDVVTPEGKIIYWDFGHWTMAGAKHLHNKLIENNLLPFSVVKAKQ